MANKKISMKRTAKAHRVQKRSNTKKIEAALARDLYRLSRVVEHFGRRLAALERFEISRQMSQAGVFELSRPAAPAQRLN